MNLVSLTDGLAAVILSNGGLFLIDEKDLPLIRDREWTTNRKTAGRSYVVSRNGNEPDILLHRFLLGLNKGDGKIGDHINGCTMDNRRSNLRVVTSLQNSWNTRRKGNRHTGYQGVTEVPGGFRARVQTRTSRFDLGVFDTPEEASQAYQSKKNELQEIILRSQT